MKRILLGFFCLSLTMAAFGQADSIPRPDTPIEPADWDAITALEDTLALLAYAIVNDSLPEHRFGACRQFIPTLVKALQKPHSFEYLFERLRAVSILYPPDSTFRIFTWQLYVDINEYRYYGAIQMNTPDLKLFPLVDRSFEVEDPEQAQLTADQWYGAVYYNLLAVEEGPAGPYYLLFGFDGNELYRKRKLIDVLSFKDGQPVFGAPVFIKAGEENEPEVVRSRILRTYSAEVSTRLNYDELMELIIFDHLIPADGKYGEGPTFYPDGSYEAYRLEDGLWRYVDKVFNQTSDEAPRPSPILDNRTKDLFGRQN